MIRRCFAGGLTLLAVGLTTPPVVADLATTETKLADLGPEAVVAYALAHNPGLAAAIEQRQELAGGLVEAWSDAYPQLDVAAGWNRTRNPSLLNSPDFADFLEEFPGFEPQSQDLWNLGIELRQVIWAGGKVKATVALAKLAAETVESRIETARLDVAARAARAWAEVIAADRARTTLEAESASRDRALALVEDRLEIGEATELERLRAVAARAELEPQLATAAGRESAALASLRAVMGLPAGAPLSVAYEPEQIPALPDLAQALRGAISRRPELLGLDLNAKSVAGEAELIRADGRPRFDFIAGWGRQARLSENLTDALYDDWRIGINAKLSLFDGGTRAGQIAQAESRERQIQLQYEDLQRRIELEVEAAWSNLETAHARRAGSAAAVAAAREAARVAREMWELGVALQLDVLQTEDLARREDLAAIEADLATWTAAIELERARGVVIFQDALRADRDGAE